MVLVVIAAFKKGLALRPRFFAANVAKQYRLKYWPAERLRSNINTSILNTSDMWAG